MTELKPSLNFLLDAMVEHPRIVFNANDTKSVIQHAAPGSYSDELVQETADIINATIDRKEQVWNAERVQALRNGIAELENAGSTEEHVGPARLTFHSLGRLQTGLDVGTEDSIVAYFQYKLPDGASDTGSAHGEASYTIPRRLVKQAGYKTGKKLYRPDNQLGIVKMIIAFAGIGSFVNEL